jgi:hypothetical protein
MAQPRRAEQCLPQEDATPEREAGTPTHQSAAAASPPLPDPRFAGALGQRSGAPHSKELQRGHAPQKMCNPARSKLIINVKVDTQEGFVDHHGDN